MHYEMEDLMEQAAEVQESMSRTYGVPEELDETDLEAGTLRHCFHPSSCFFICAMACLAQLSLIDRS